MTFVPRGGPGPAGVGTTRSSIAGQPGGSHHTSLVRRFGLIAVLVVALILILLFVPRFRSPGVIGVGAARASIAVRSSGPAGACSTDSRVTAAAASSIGPAS
ncbi:MAG: hypothetical protein M0020_07660 [Actinomycetota bacterium]|nr:hypothetical protein [Actinomycetota bacterium]